MHLWMFTCTPSLLIHHATETSYDPEKELKKLRKQKEKKIEEFQKAAKKKKKKESEYDTHLSWGTPSVPLMLEY